MSWIKLDDGFAQHPKLMEVGPEGLTLQVRAFCYAGRYLTDGFIPEDVAEGLTHGLSQDSMGWPNRMVAAKLWEKRKYGYFIHDYLVYNPTKEQVLESRKRKSEGGKKGADNRWHTQHTQAQPITQPITHAIAQPRQDAIVHPIGSRHAPLPHPQKKDKTLNLNSPSPGVAHHLEDRDGKGFSKLGEEVLKLAQQVSTEKPT